MSMDQLFPELSTGSPRKSTGNLPVIADEWVENLWDMDITCTWNLKHLFINGCFNWMIPNLYIVNGGFTKHPFKTGWLSGTRYAYTWPN